MQASMSLPAGAAMSLPAGSGFRLLTLEEKRAIAKGVGQSFEESIIKEIHKVGLQMGEEARVEIAQARAEKAQAQAEKAQAQAQIEAARAKKAQAQEDKAKAVQEEKIAITKLFYEAFYGKDKGASLSVETINQIFSKYIEGKIELKITDYAAKKVIVIVYSSESFANYLNDNPALQKFDLFKFTFANLDALSCLSNHLASPECKVKMIRLKKDMADGQMANLAETIAARNGSLKVTYV